MGRKPLPAIAALVSFIEPDRRWHRVLRRRPCPTSGENACWIDHHDRLSAREREVCDAARRRDRLDVVALLDGLEAVPQAHAAAEQDRYLHDVECVDQVGGEEVADGGGATADAYVEVAGRLAGEVERFLRGGVDEVERGAAFHLDRRARMMGEHEHRCGKQLVAAGLLTRDDARRGQRAAYSLTEAGIQVLPVMAALGNWGLAHRDGERRLRVRVELLRDGGPELVAAMMDELRELHLGVPRPDPGATRASDRLRAAYEAVLGDTPSEDAEQ